MELDQKVFCPLTHAPGLRVNFGAWNLLMGRGTSLLPPAPIPLSLAGIDALVINLSCAFILARFRSHSGSLTRAAFLSARNDAVANVAIILAGIVTAYTLSGWPDLIVGLGILAINADASREVWSAAREEHRQADV